MSMGCLGINQSAISIDIRCLPATGSSIQKGLLICIRMLKFDIMHCNSLLNTDQRVGLLHAWALVVSIYVSPITILRVLGSFMRCIVTHIIIDINIIYI